EGSALCVGLVNRQRDGSQNTDNGDDDHQFNECESSSCGVCHELPPCLLVQDIHELSPCFAIRHFQIGDLYSKQPEFIGPESIKEPSSLCTTPLPVRMTPTRRQ